MSQPPRTLTQRQVRPGTRACDHDKPAHHTHTTVIQALGDKARSSTASGSQTPDTQGPAWPFLLNGHHLGSFSQAGGNQGKSGDELLPSRIKP